MIYLLIRSLETLLTDWGIFGLFRVLTFVEFRAVLAMLLAATSVLVFGKPVIRWLVRMKIGDNPNFGHGDLDELMKSKANTPTMGGILIVGSIFAVTVLLADISNYYVVMGMLCLLWLAGVGIARGGTRARAKGCTPGRSCCFNSASRCSWASSFNTTASRARLTICMAKPT